MDHCSSKAMFHLKKTIDMSMDIDRGYYNMKIPYICYWIVFHVVFIANVLCEAILYKRHMRHCFAIVTIVKSN